MICQFEVDLCRFRISVNDVFSDWVDSSAVAHLTTIDGLYISAMKEGILPETHQVYKIYPMKTEIVLAGEKDERNGSSI